MENGSQRSVSRRDFLRASGVLVVAFTAAPLADATASGQGPFDTHPSHVDPDAVDSWLAITEDGAVTVYTGKCELGQGMQTAQAQLVAEELGVGIEHVRLVMCDTEVAPDQGTTSGSQSTPTNFNARNLAQAAATARAVLTQLAAERLGVPAEQLVLAGGVARVAANTSRQASFGQLVAGKKLNARVDPRATRRPPGDWVVLGKPVPRTDMAAMVTGRLEYVQNVRVPGMLYGAVVRPPGVGATLIGVEEGSVAHLPGVVKVVVRKNFVGLVAQKPWQAIQAAQQLRARWTRPPALPPRPGFYEYMKTLPSRDAYTVNSGDVDEKLKTAHARLAATYLHPFQMHGSLGTSCAVADVRPGRATFWSATQSAYPTRNGVALLLGVPPEQVRVVYTRGSGCYGLNGADTVSYDAALLSQAVGRPVRVQLSRQQEMAWGESYGFPYLVEQRVGLDGDGSIIAWDYEAWFASRGGRPGYERPGNIVTGMLAGFATAPFRPERAAEPPGEFRNGSNAAPSYVAGRAARRAGGAGTVASERVLTHTVESPFFTGPLRSPSRLQNTFAHECFLDEIAAHVGADPLAYRLRHLADERLKAVLNAAARAVRWKARPSPIAGAGNGGTVNGRGLACVAYEGTNGYAAMVAEVAVDRASGRIRATRFVVALDCGPVSNPDGLRNQAEGGTLQGLSRALSEEVTWDDHQVTSVDWASYRSLTMGEEVPGIETILIDRTDVPATGAGETAITLVAAAVGNAVFDATGARLRQVPFTPDRVKSALAALR